MSNLMTVSSRTEALELAGLMAKSSMGRHFVSGGEPSLSGANAHAEIEANLFLLICICDRLGIPFEVGLANAFTYASGQFGWRGAFIIDRLNTHGMIDGSLQFETEGGIELGDYRVRAHAMRDGQRLETSWIYYGEALLGDKLYKSAAWRENPELQMRYRVARMFAREFCPTLFSANGFDLLDGQDDTARSVRVNGQKMALGGKESASNEREGVKALGKRRRAGRTKAKAKVAAIDSPPESDSADRSAPKVEDASSGGTPVEGLAGEAKHIHPPGASLADPVETVVLPDITEPSPKTNGVKINGAMDLSRLIPDSAPDQSVGDF